MAITLGTLYAIRHTPTGHFLPAPYNRGRRNQTSIKAVASTVRPPRLFRRYQDAKNALRWYLRGKTFVRPRVDNDDGYLGYEWVTEPIETRHAEDFEIIEVDLIEGRADTQIKLDFATRLGCKPIAQRGDIKWLK